MRSVRRSVTRMVVFPSPFFFVGGAAKTVVIRYAVVLSEPLLPDRWIVLVDPSLDAFACVVTPQLMDPYRLLPSRRSDRPVLALRIKAVVIAALPEFALELLDGQAQCNRLIDRLPRNVIPCRHSCMLHLVNVGAHSFAFRVLDNRQSVLQTYPVGGITQQSGVGLAAVELMAVTERHTVDDDV